MNFTDMVCLLAARGIKGSSEVSVTCIVWLLLFCVLAVKGLSRPIWGLCLYVMTMFIFPAGWWWGKGTLTRITDRWSLAAALIFVLGVASTTKDHGYRIDATASKVFKLLFLYTLNATLVHYMLASNEERSYNDLTLVWKQLGLFFLMYWAVTSPADLKRFFYVIILCCCYVGYEAVINNRGKFSRARLEGIFIPGAAESNYLAALLAMSLPLAGVLILIGRRNDKIIAAVSAYFTFEVILRCNSRGAFLALVTAGSMMYLASRAQMRRYANWGLLLVVAAVYFQAKDPKIWERFYTIAPVGEGVITGEKTAAAQDPAAESRIEFWKAAITMIQDYPLGSGAEAAFKSNRGSPYIRHLGTSPYRAVHNGYLDIAAGWGVQGLMLYLSAIFVAWWSLRRAVRYNLLIQEPVKAFIGVSIEAALATQLVACFFISSLDGEWFYWLMALMLAYGHLYGPKEGAIPTLPRGRIFVTQEVMDRALAEDPFADPPQPVTQVRRLMA